MPPMVLCGVTGSVLFVGEQVGVLGGVLSLGGILGLVGSLLGGLSEVGPTPLEAMIVQGRA